MDTKQDAPRYEYQQWVQGEGWCIMGRGDDLQELKRRGLRSLPEVRIWDNESNKEV